MLSEKSTGFSQMLEELGVSSSHLTYHLESLGELVSKMESGDYKLSTFGEAAVNTMRIVEDAPAVQSENSKFRFLRWKPVIALLVIGLVLLGSFSVLQYNAMNQLSEEHRKLQDSYNQLLSLTGSTDKARRFLQNVVKLDLTKYDATLLSNTVGPSDLAGVTEQILKYSLTGSESKMDVVLRFRNNFLSAYEVTLLDGTPIYDEPQAFSVLESAWWLLEKLKLYEEAPYLNSMIDILSRFPEINEIEMTEGNLNFNVSISGLNNERTEIGWFYTENDVDFIPKGFKLVFENHVLTKLSDGYFLFTIGSTQINVDSVEAIQIARNAVNGYTWRNANGQQVSGFTIKQASAVFHPVPREGEEDVLALFPCWYVTLYLDNIYSDNINRISVGVWADTGKIEQIKPLSG